jgi:hypothetical protein
MQLKIFFGSLAITAAFLGCGGAPFTAAIDSPASHDAVTTGVGPDDGSNTDSGTATVEAAMPEVGEAAAPPDAAPSDASSETNSSDTHVTNDSGCSPGATECASGTEVETCTPSGQWGTRTTCPYACTSGGCGGVCVPGATQCYGTMWVETCGLNGTWGGMMKCGNCDMTPSGAICI